MNKIKNLITLTLTLLLLVSCAAMTVKFTPYPGAPSNLTPTNNVEILNTMPTNKQYVQLGEIVAEGFSDQEVINKIITKAKEVGADAALIVSREDKGETLPGLRVWRAVVIKYR
jgi:PBP1b-binding outer membrane lipoprotein LpoB